MAIRAFFKMPTCTDEPKNSGAKNQVLTDLYKPIVGMEVSFTVTEPSFLDITGHIGFQIEGTSDHKTRFMTGVTLTLNGAPLRGSGSTENWTYDEHYHDRHFAYKGYLKPGVYKVGVMACKKNKYVKDRAKVYVKSARYNGLFVSVQPRG